MRTTQISARWTGEALNYIGTDTKDNQIAMGGDQVSPGQLLLIALAGCMGMDVLSILQKKRQNVSDVLVRVTGHQPDDHPRPYQIAEVDFTIQGDQVDPKAIARSIELSVDKYCMVGQTLANNTEIKTSFTVA